jgi:hypothetical protein
MVLASPALAGLAFMNAEGKVIDMVYITGPTLLSTPCVIDTWINS